MWWIIGSLIGAAWNARQEQRHPEIRAARLRREREETRFALVYLLPILVGTILVVAVVFNLPTSTDMPIRVSGHSLVPVLAPAPTPDSLSMSVALPSLTVESQPDPYHGKEGVPFGKDWVILDGKRISGITCANPAPNGEVALLYADGGKDVPAASLPQGFLDAWQLTPAKFQAVENQ